MRVSLQGNRHDPLQKVQYGARIPRETQGYSVPGDVYPTKIPQHEADHGVEGARFEASDPAVVNLHGEQ